MASLKMQQWEAEFLKYTGAVKELVLKHITEDLYGDEVDEIKQKFLIEINNMFNSGHTKVRKMNKTVAFLHRQIEENKGGSSGFKLGDQVGTDKGTEPQR